MNSDEFIAKLSERLNIEDTDAATEMVASVSDILKDNLQNEKKISLEGFGVFGVNKEKERVVVNTSTQQRILVPPALSVSFEVSSRLAKKMNLI